MSGLTHQLEFSPEEAFVGLAIVAVSVDGDHAEAEELAVTQAILSAELFASYPADKLITMINNLFNCISEQGIDVLFQNAIAALPINLHQDVLNAVAKIVMADGKISSEEQQLLDNLSNAFDIPKEEINQTLEQQKI